MSDPTNVNAADRIFLRADPVLDPDGFTHWIFPELASGPRASSYAIAHARFYMRVTGRIWEIVETPSGVLHPTLKARDGRGSLHCRALTRDETAILLPMRNQR